MAIREASPNGHYASLPAGGDRRAPWACREAGPPRLRGPASSTASARPFVPATTAGAPRRPALTGSDATSSSTASATRPRWASVCAGNTKAISGTALAGSSCPARSCARAPTPAAPLMAPPVGHITGRALPDIPPRLAVYHSSRSLQQVRSDRFAGIHGTRQFDNAVQDIER